MAHAGEDRTARQLGAVHEEQQADGQISNPLEYRHALPARWQQRGDGHRTEQGQSEVVR